MEGVALINCDWKTDVNWGCPVHAPWTLAHKNRESVLSAGSVVKTRMLKVASGMEVVLEIGQGVAEKR